MSIENEFRVRPVTRYVLTHYHRDERVGSVSELGEFQNIQRAESVGVAMQALVPGSTFVTLEGRTPMSAAEVFGISVPPRGPQVGDKIIVNAPDLTTEATVEAVHEWKDRRVLDVYFEAGTYYQGYGGGTVVDNGAPYMLEPRTQLGQ